MDDQQKTDNQAADSPIEILTTDAAPQTDAPEDTSPINDLVPPPAPDETGINIEVKTTEAGDTTEASEETTAAETSEVSTGTGEAMPLVAEPPAEEANASEGTEVVTAPAETEATEAETAPATGASAEASTISEPGTEAAEPAVPQAPADNGEPAVVGIAASQMKAGQQHPHRNNKKLAAVMVVIVALLLAGTAVFVYLSANKNTAKESTQNTSANNQQAAATTPATAADIDAAIADVDAAFAPLNDEADFADQDLSDATLGL